MSWFPARWPPTMPDALQLYSLATPNGQKVSICLEEMGLTYEAHTVNILNGDQNDQDFRQLSPNGKIPALLDPHGPEDQPVLLMESIVILRYLAEMTGQFYPSTYLSKLEAEQWLTFQTAHVGPMFGQFGHFYKFAVGKTPDTYAKDRYRQETRRLLGVLNQRLLKSEFILRDYSIVDMALVPWVDCLIDYYQAYEYLEFDEFQSVKNWHQRVTQRPAYIAGRTVCSI
jgi:GST-like protein